MRNNKKILVAAAVSTAMILTACGGSEKKDNNKQDENDVSYVHIGLGEHVKRLSHFGLVTHIEPFDINKDGRMDLIIFTTTDSYDEGNAFVYVNTENGFSLDESYFSGPFDTWIESITLADINNDEHLDIIPHVDAGTAVAPLIWNETQNQFVPLAQTELPITSGFVAIDIDGVGQMDLLSHDFNGHWFVSKNDGAGQFSVTDPIFSIDLKGKGQFIYSPIVTDVDGDGRDDLIFSGPFYEDGWVDEKVPVLVMLNKDDGWEQAKNADIFTGGEPSFTHFRIARVADFNGDGLDDIVIANHGYDADPNYTGEHNGLLLSNNSGFTVNLQGQSGVVAQQHVERNGQFITEDVTDIFNYRGFTHALTVGDLNKDGHQDIVFADITGEDVGYWSSVRILYGKGDGTFDLRFVRMAHDFMEQGAGGWTSAAMADLNNDGYLDLVLGTMNNGSFIFYNDKKGYFR